MTKSKAVQPVKAGESPVDPDQTLKASKALLAHIKKASKERAAKADKKSLLDAADDEGGAAAAETPIWLTLTTKRHVHDSSRLQPGKIVLPHPLNTDEEATVCLITADPQRHYKNMVASAEFPDALRARVTRVVDVAHLAAKFKAYEAQRRLFAEHDVFLADDRIVNRLPKLLGKTFYRTTAKRPVPVVLQRPRPKVDGRRVKRARGTRDEDDVNAKPPAEAAAEMERALGSALVHLSPSTNTAVKVGFASMTAAQVADNVAAVAGALVDKWVPQKWKNVRSLLIKGPDTAALPIWETSELWLEEGNVLPDGSDEAKALLGQKQVQKANIGKKRKSVEGVEEKKEPPNKKSRRVEAAEADDGKLDKQIAERKRALRQQKAAAKKAMDD